VLYRPCRILAATPLSGHWAYGDAGTIVPNDKPYEYLYKVFVPSKKMYLYIARSDEIEVSDAPR
jgi:hypothetical protein